MQFFGRFMLKFRVFKGFLAELLQKLPKFHKKVTLLKEIFKKLSSRFRTTQENFKNSGSNFPKTQKYENFQSRVSRQSAKKKPAV